MLPLIPSPRIVPIDKGSPLWKPDNIPEEPLIPRGPELTIAENIQQVIDDLNKQQEKGIIPSRNPTALIGLTRSLKDGHKPK